MDLLVSDYFLAKRILDGDAGYDNGAYMVEDGGDKILNFVNVGECLICVRLSLILKLNCHYVLGCVISCHGIYRWSRYYL